ncbi:PREDICTED: uncharacterized protein LOC109236430 [Nicotiana attenuata]|uniref:uncharacterized protein LOC109236430 n=1 Tax=Nicotiana attenuata TaxID=49451 RepID=UPI000904DA17|nr:PREDICTED: uncharacterized protein LOC109236430 [Nicotiana attenuata]
MTTIRTLIGVVVKKGWKMFQLDVNNDFLHGDLHEEVYMETPPVLLVKQPGMVCKLNKSLYGLKQASRQLYAKLTEALYSRGYTHSMFDYSLFYKGKGNSVTFVAVYVDDVIITGAHLEKITSLTKFLHETFRIKDLGRLHYFLGLEILYKGDGVLIKQRKFTQDLLKEFDCIGCTTVTSPLDPTVKLKADEEISLSDPGHYRKLVGKLNFLIGTRPDIAYSVQHLSPYMQNPRDTHLRASVHVLRYLKGSLSLGIFLSNSRDYRVRAFCDSDWAACPETRKSVSGYIVLLGDSPISWKSKKQSTISLSSAEAEYRVVRKVVGELVWLA